MNILVTAISGNLGQAMCTLIKKHFNLFNIIGADAILPEVGFGLCVETLKVPFAAHPNYLQSIKTIVDENNIELIVPGNEVELHKITSDDQLSKITLASSNKTINTLSDKYSCYSLFKNNNLPFCETFLLSEYKGQFDEIIVKPRKGSGSKNIYINPSSLSAFDNNYVVQKFERGIELTIPFYINSNNELLSFLPLIKYGSAPNNAYETFDSYNDDILKILLKLKSIVAIKGPCNLQCIINDSGIHPFETNCRYSGSVDIQDELGLNILEIGLNEFLLKKPFSGVFTLKKGFALRRYKSDVFINQRMNQSESK